MWLRVYQFLEELCVGRFPGTEMEEFVGSLQTCRYWKDYFSSLCR